jgi:Tol biopolymer transport system component
MKFSKKLLLAAFLIVGLECLADVKISIVKHGKKDRTLDWSHANNQIAFCLLRDDGYYDIATMLPDGSDVKILTEDIPGLPQKHNSNPTWHPSGKYIVFQAEKKRHFGNSIFSTPGIGFNCDLWCMSIENKKVFQLTNLKTKRHILSRGNTTGVLHSHFSPNGNMLLWGQLVKTNGKGKMGIWEMKLADFVIKNGNPTLKNIVTLTPGKQKKWYETHGFSPDNKKIIFSGSLQIGQGDSGMDIYTINLSSKRLERLTFSKDVWDEHAHYSPDGDSIVWIKSVNKFSPSNWRKTMQTEYFIMKKDGGKKRQLTFFNTSGHSHNKLFDGKRVICADSSWNSNGSVIMASIAVDGEPYLVKIDMEKE